MNHKEIMASLNSAIDSVSESISDYVLTPGKDFTRIRKLPANTLMKFLIAEGSSSTKSLLISSGRRTSHHHPLPSFNRG